MSTVGSVGASSQVFAQIDKLNKLVGQATVAQTDFATKLVKLAVQENVDAQKQATAAAALDKVV